MNINNNIDEYTSDNYEQANTKANAQSKVFNRTMHDEDKNTYLYVNQNTPVKPNPISYNTTTAIIFLTHQAHHELKKALHYIDYFSRFGPILPKLPPPTPTPTPLFEIK